MYLPSFSAVSTFLGMTVQLYLPFNVLASQLLYLLLDLMVLKTLRLTAVSTFGFDRDRGRAASTFGIKVL